MGNWAVSYSHLDSEQKDFLDRHLTDGHNYWISGFPGSGKSTILAHSIKTIKGDNPDATYMVVVYTHSLIDMFRAALNELGVNNLNIETMYQFLSESRSYDYILCDEIQDMTPRIINAMRERCKHLIVAGDENQSIFEKDVKYKEDTVSAAQIETLTGGKKYELSIVHRLSPAIQEAVVRFMPSFSKMSNLRNPADKSSQIRLCRASSKEKEVKYIWDRALQRPNSGSGTSVVLLPMANEILDFVDCVCDIEGVPRWERTSNHWNKPDFEAMNKYLREHNIRLQYVGNGVGNFNDTSDVFIMTYHSSKGLDFDSVFLPDIDSQLYISSDSQIAQAAFMVAMTRSRNELYICYSGEPNRYISNFAGACSNVNIDEYFDTTTSSGPSF